MRRFKALYLGFFAAGLGMVISLPTQGQIMSNLNSFASVAPNTQAGMYSWTINGQQEMSQQWYWYSLGPVGGGTAPASIDSLALIGDSQPTANTLNLTYAAPFGGGSFTISLGYTLTGSAPGVYKSDMGESISIQNNSAVPLQMEFYKYQDFSLQGGVGANQNNVSITGNILGYNSAIQTSPLMTALSDTVIAPGANEAEASTEFLTRGKLNNGSAPVVLNNVTSAGPGAVTSAFEFDLNIAPGSTQLISEDDLVESSALVPEPSTLVLIPFGALALVAWQKRRQRA